MIALFFLHPRVLQSDLLAGVKAKISKSNVAEFERSRAETESLVSQAIASGVEFETFLAAVGRFYGLPGTRGHSSSPLPREWMPLGLVEDSIIQSIYGSKPGISRVVVINRQELPRAHRLWTAYRRSLEREMVAKKAGPPFPGFPPAGDVNLWDFWKSFSPHPRSADSSARALQDQYVDWALPVEIALEQAIRSQGDIVFTWRVRDAGAHKGKVECEVLPIDFPRVKVSFETNDLGYLRGLMEQEKARWTDETLGGLERHHCLPWLVAKALAPKDQAVWDDVDDQAAAWYMMLQSGTVEPFTKDRIDDLIMPLSTKQLDRLKEVASQSRPAAPDTEVLARVQDYWAGPEEMPWDVICDELANRVFPQARKLLQRDPRKGEQFYVARCDRYDEVW